MAMRPPPDTERNSTRSTSKEPVASRQKRGPMPPQRAPITTGSSAIGSAPATSSSSAERRAFRSASSTGPKPKLLSSSAARPPIGPPPATSTGSPGIGSRRRIACNATASGSHSAAISGAMSDATRSRPRAGNNTSSAKPPSHTSPTKPSEMQRLARPARQCGHRPQGTRESATTRSPTLNPRTSAPTSTTSPENSCPGVTGSCASHIPVRKLWTSEPQIPAARTRIRT